jgi:hypothetical protein
MGPGEVVLRKPITGVARACAFARNGAIAAAPRRAMKLRRLITFVTICRAIAAKAVHDPSHAGLSEAASIRRRSDNLPSYDFKDIDSAMLG